MLNDFKAILQQYVKGDAKLSDVTDTLEPLLRKHPQLAGPIESQIEQLTVRSSPERLAKFLFELSGVRSGQTTVQLPLDKALIAGRLGMQPETFSRALSRLRNQGVTCNGNAVHIADVSALGLYSRHKEQRGAGCMATSGVAPRRTTNGHRTAPGA